MTIWWLLSHDSFMCRTWLVHVFVTRLRHVMTTLPSWEICRHVMTTFLMSPESPRRSDTQYRPCIERYTHIRRVYINTQYSVLWKRHVMNSCVLGDVASCDDKWVVPSWKRYSNLWEMCSWVVGYERFCVVWWQVRCCVMRDDPTFAKCASELFHMRDVPRDVPSGGDKSSDDSWVATKKRCMHQKKHTHEMWTHSYTILGHVISPHLSRNEEETHNTDDESIETHTWKVYTYIHNTPSRDDNCSDHFWIGTKKRYTIQINMHQKWHKHEICIHTYTIFCKWRQPIWWVLRRPMWWLLSRHEEKKQNTDHASKVTHTWNIYRYIHNTLLQGGENAKNALSL